eukprot:scaffold10551_cov69-Phaeocystis_antarctica.AAC.4
MRLHCAFHTARRRRRSLHEVSTPDVLSGRPPWSGLYGPVLWLIFFSSAARSWKEYSGRIFSGCLWRYDHPGFWPHGSQELNGSVRCSGDAFIAPTAAQTDGPREPPLKGMRPP